MTIMLSCYHAIILIMTVPLLQSLQAKNEEALRSLAEKLQENGVDHKLWIEQPENIPTCVATKPYPKAEIQTYFKKFKLFK